MIAPAPRLHRPPSGHGTRPGALVPATPVAVGRKVVLSEVRNSDIAELQRMIMQPECRRSWRSRGDYWSPAELQGRLSSDSALALVGRRVDGGALVGLGELLDVSLVDRRASLGLVSHPSTWTSGMGIELAFLFLQVAFASYPIEKVSLLVLADNARLIPGLHRLFVHEGTLRRHLNVHGAWSDVEVFALWRDDLPALLERFRVPVIGGVR